MYCPFAQKWKLDHEQEGYLIFLCGSFYTTVSLKLISFFMSGHAMESNYKNAVELMLSWEQEAEKKEPQSRISLTLTGKECSFEQWFKPTQANIHHNWKELLDSYKMHNSTTFGINCTFRLTAWNNLQTPLMTHPAGYATRPLLGSQASPLPPDTVIPNTFSKVTLKEEEEMKHQYNQFNW